jgi:hypothetical protein
MHYTHEGLTLWYGTEDTPAPEGVVESGENLSVIAGVSPANPSNTVSVLYRVGASFERTVRATLLRTEYDAGRQYFQASFPMLPPESKIEYIVIGESSGRRVPNPCSVTGLKRQFEVPRATNPTSVRGEASQPNLAESRLPFSIEYLSRFTIHLGDGPPEIIGETPDGIKVNWYISSGEFAGPKLNGKISHEGGDWMTIRRDGVGIMDVRATLETVDGALIYIHYPGYFELGENGYENFLKKKWPPTPPTRTTPRLITAHPKYLWVNRLQCIGIGRVVMKEPIYEYDLYGMF